MVGRIVVVGVLTCCALLYSMCDLKTARFNVQCCLIRKHVIRWKQPKPFVVRKVKVQLITVEQPHGPRNSTWVARTLTINKSQVGQKPWILRPCTKPQRQSWQVTLKEYHASTAFPSSVLFVTFMVLRICSCQIEPHIIKILQNFWHTKVNPASVRFLIYKLNRIKIE